MQLGDDRVLYLYYVDDFYPIGCLSGNSFSEVTDMLDATMRTDSDGWTQAIPSFQSFTISFNGILNIDGRGGTVLSYANVQTLKRARTKVQWKIISSEGDSEEGYGYITNLANVAGTQEFVTFDGVIQGVGEPTASAWTPPTIDDLDSMIPPYEAAQG